MVPLYYYTSVSLAQRRTRQDDRLDIVVHPQRPNKQFSRINRLDELPWMLSCSGDNSQGSLFELNRASLPCHCYNPVIYVK